MKGCNPSQPVDASVRSAFLASAGNYHYLCAMFSHCMHLPNRHSKAWLRLERGGAWLVLLASFLVYCLTVEPTASYWDCPEYILVGSRLETGHPPGNPTWMLAARMASMLAPSPEYVALAVNLTSGLFTALAAMLLYLCALRLLRPAGEETGAARGARIVAALTGALAFAWCDTAWFSAVEAEVYAFSIFCTALCLWIMLRWTDVAFSPPGYRLLVLLAYVTGLSLGVHQLNLLCFPTLALIYVFRRNPGRDCFRKAAAACLLSLVAIASVLYGVMPGVPDIAGLFELLAVNGLGMPFHSGAVAYAAVTLAVFCAAIIFCHRGLRLSAATATAVAVWLSGALGFCGGPTVAAVLSLLLGTVLFIFWKRLRHRAYVGLFCLGMLLTGYSTYTLIIVRSAAGTPVNEGAPSDIFAFKGYLCREQYGSKPLLRGRTPQSEILRKEEITGSGDSISATYSEAWRDVGGRRYAKAMAGASPRRSRASLDSADRAFNREAARRDAEGRDAYAVARREIRYRTAPELDMWLSRLYSGDAADIKAYEPWSGMTAATMDSVLASTAVDSAGNAVGRLNPLTGQREKEWRKKPTMLQNLRYMFSYQIGYMYLRYIMWNFAGRQNDVHSTGEADNGNFITGIAPLDDAMLGPQNLLPPRHSKRNPGHHVYYLIPLALGLIGLGAELAGGRRGRRTAAVVGSLFVMTGVVIVLYVNQTPGEPRERDYSYIGSIFAFAIWIGAGGLALMRACLRIPSRRWRTVATAAAGAGFLAVPVWMLCSNMPDHDRSDRFITRDMAFNSLAFLERDAILFVNGDNYTFPLWYAREVERVRPDVRIINLAYLGTPWYARQLTMTDRDSHPVAMTAKASDLAYDNFSLSLHGAKPGEPRTRDAVEALKELYAQTGPHTPRLKADTLLLPATEGTERPWISLRSVAAGKRTLGLSPLLVIDILATNAASPDPRPVYWLHPLKPYHFSGAYPYTIDEGLVRRYTGRREKSDSLDTRRFFSILTSDGRGKMPLFRYGQARDCYVDPTSATVIGRVRQSMLKLASRLLDEGRPEDALVIAGKISYNIPFSSLESRVFTDSYTAYSEATELARIYFRCAQALPPKTEAGLARKKRLQEKGFELLRNEIDRLGHWRRFYLALPPWRRQVMSPTPKIERGQFYAPVALWLEAGGSPDELRRMPAMRGVDLEKERREWEKSTALRRILRLARFPETASADTAAYIRFRALGGRASDLDAYTEAASSPLRSLLPD